MGVHTCLNQFIPLLGLKSPSSSSLKNSFVGCLLLCIIFIVSVFIDLDFFPQVCYQIFSETYSNLTYRFPSVLWKFVARVQVYVISTVVVNKLICFDSRQFL